MSLPDRYENHPLMLAPVIQLANETPSLNCGSREPLELLSRSGNSLIYTPLGIVGRNQLGR
jgi:hypothetical protein